MKRLLVFLIVLGVGLGGLYLWWQIKAVKMVTEGVHSACRGLVTNPANLEVTVPKPVKITGIGRATVPQLIIKGQELTLENGPKIAAAKLVLNNLEVAGPPFHFTGIADGYYLLSVTDDDVTAYLRKRGLTFAVARIPLDTLTVRFAGKEGAVLDGHVRFSLPVIGEKRVPLTVKGMLIPSNINGEVDYKVRQVIVEKTKFTAPKMVEDSLAKINPVITFADWPFLGDITRIDTTDGMVTMNGRITGVR
jgi:hypothetical protein